MRNKQTILLMMFIKTNYLKELEFDF